MIDRQAFETAPARLTIDVGAVVENWKRLARLSGKARTGAAIKADAYGLGAPAIGPALAKAGCRDFFVADAAEGARLRASLTEADIFVLSGIWPGTEATIAENRLIPMVNSEQQFGLLDNFSATYPYALQIDTGMNRLGLTIEAALSSANARMRKPKLMMSHLACSESAGNPMNRQQLESFQQLADTFEGVESSLASTGGILLGSDYHFDLTRPGIGLYGGKAGSRADNPMLPVAHAEARILQVRDVRRGEVASYGAAHIFDRDSRIAVVGAGYADGWQRAMSGSGVRLRRDGSAGASGFVNGARVPLIGRVTMDLTMFDIGQVEEGLIREGDYMELFGANIALDEAAESAGTIGYELLTGLGRRYVRRYI